MQNDAMLTHDAETKHSIIWVVDLVVSPTEDYVVNWSTYDRIRMHTHTQKQTNGSSDSPTELLSCNRVQQDNTFTSALVLRSVPCISLLNLKTLPAVSRKLSSELESDA